MGERGRVRELWDFGERIVGTAAAVRFVGAVDVVGAGRGTRGAGEEGPVGLGLERFFGLARSVVGGAAGWAFSLSEVVKWSLGDGLVWLKGEEGYDQVRTWIASGFCS